MRPPAPSRELGSVPLLLLLLLLLLNEAARALSRTRLRTYLLDRCSVYRKTDIHASLLPLKIFD